ncbi:MAG: restriction endonuclease subunit S, partial [Spirochaeta sp.]|nr:restriction endonuclease subunit S [Spirochaeta sp.]
MKRNDNRTLTPKLRFPEFRDEPGWVARKIGELAVVKASGDLDTALFSNLRSATHQYPVYSNAIENEGLYGYYTVPQYNRHSVTITARGTLGVALLRDHQFMGIGRLIVVSDLLNLDRFFLKECWNHLAVVPGEVTSIPQLTAVAVRDTVLPIPSPPEQQKIAECLSSLDRLIAAEGRKLVTLRDHKRGLMQQLFPQPGETQPRLRFPKFRDKGEWIKQRVADLLIKV